MSNQLRHLPKRLILHPFYDAALNGRADALRVFKSYDSALIDISKAIELNSNQSVYFATLAEIYADMGKLEEFYLNLTIALSKGLKPTNMYYAADVYQRFILEERFLNLISKYEINIEDITNDPDVYIEN